MKKRSFDLKMAHCPGSGVRDPRDRVDRNGSSEMDCACDGGTICDTGLFERPSLALSNEDCVRLIKCTNVAFSGFEIFAPDLLSSKLKDNDDFLRLEVCR